MGVGVMFTIRIVLLLSVLCGLIYPLAITGVAQVLFARQAHGSRVVRDGRVVGSELIGQAVDDPRYFQSRPSATTPFAYNAGLSSGSNLGVKNPARHQAMEDRRKALLAADPANTVPVPAELLMASGSGLDPHISPAAAAWQVSRVARLRGLDRQKVEELVKRHIETRQFGILGDPVVNVMLLNQALDRI